jgi:hypothetical protein
MPRREFLSRVDEAAYAPDKPGRWQVEDDIETISHWRRGERPTSPLLVEQPLRERNFRNQLADA